LAGGGMVVLGVVVESAFEVDHGQSEGLHAELATRPSEQAFVGAPDVSVGGVSG